MGWGFLTVMEREAFKLRRSSEEAVSGRFSNSRLDWCVVCTHKSI